MSHITATEDQHALSLTLPWPPSVNSYYRCVGGRPLISAKGREYRRSVEGDVLDQLGVPKPLACPLKTTAWFFPPNRQERDLDNYFKALFDAMEHAGVYENDRQIKDIEASMKPPSPKQGRVVVWIYTIPAVEHNIKEAAV